jgi:hypothetical protein
MPSAYDGAVLDEAMLEDERLLSAPRTARLLHIEATVWAKARRTDGRIPKAALRRFTDEKDPEEQAAALVATGLWRDAGDAWFLEDYLDHQMPRSRVEAKIESHRARQRAYEERQRGRPPGASSGTSPDASSDDGTNQPTSPPTRLQGKGGEGGTRADAAEPSSRSENGATGVAPIRTRAEQIASFRSWLEENPNASPASRKAAERRLARLEAEEASA